MAEVWYKAICSYVISKGYTCFDEDTGEEIPLEPEDIKLRMKKEILGYKRVRIKGEVTEKVPKTSKLPKGEMYDYMNKLYHKWFDLGLILPVPEDSDYRKLQDKQNG